MNWLKQPSTIRGLFILVGVCGWNLRPELQDAIINLIVVGLALIEVIRNEHAPTPKLPPIALIGQAGISDADRADALRRVADERLYRPGTEPAQPDPGWNG